MSGNFNQPFHARQALGRLNQKMDAYNDDVYDEGDGDDEFEQAVGNCYLMDDGYCLAAGSEYCDWECPFR